MILEAEMGELFATIMKPHIGHKLEIVEYGDPSVNMSLECETCHVVLIDTELDEEPEKEGAKVE